MITAKDEMKKYDFIEGTEFDPLMPKAIDANGGIGTKSGQPVVEFMGAAALGHDQLQVVDVEKFFEENGTLEP